jgi:hypothetical protein
MITLTNHLIIGAIGEPQVGKSTVLAFIAEILFEQGIDRAEVISDLEGLVITDIDKLPIRKGIGKKEFKELILIDNIQSQAQSDYLRTEYGAIIIRVRRTPSTGESHWSNCTETDCFIYNDGSLRLLKFQLRDLIEAEMSNLEKYKERVYEHNNRTIKNT